MKDDTILSTSGDGSCRRHSSSSIWSWVWGSRSLADKRVVASGDQSNLRRRGWSGTGGWGVVRGGVEIYLFIYLFTVIYIAHFP